MLDYSFVSEKPFVEQRTITPKLAEFLLENHGPSMGLDRSMSMQIVRGYAAEMSAGQWGLTNPIHFDIYGERLDGKHRLAAVTLADIDVQFYIALGGEPGSFERFGKHRALKPDQFLPGPRAKFKAAATSFLGVVSGTFVNPPKLFGGVRAGGVALSEIIATYDVWAEEIDYYVDVVTKASSKAKLPPGAHLAVVAQAARTPHAHKLDEWFEGIVEGINLSQHDSRRLLRNNSLANPDVFNNGNKAHVSYCMIAKAWNKFALGEETKTLRYTPSEGAIKVVQ